MRKLLFGLVLLLFTHYVTSAQQKHPVEKKIPQKVNTLPVRPGAGFKKSPATPTRITKPVRPVTTNATLPGFVRQPLQRPVKMPVNARTNQPVRIPSLFTYRKTLSNTSQRTLDACDPVVLTRQSQIDSFPLLYPDCNVVQNLRIDGTNAMPHITNLDSLKYVNEVLGDLDILNTDILNLNPLNNITKIGFYFYLTNNEQMQSIGMYNIWELGGVVFINQPNLHQLSDVFGSLNSPTLWSVLLINMGLDDLTSLADIQSMSNIAIIGCTNITSLDGLQNLQTCSGGIQIAFNFSLEDISQISQLDDIDYGGLQISYNTQLPNLQGIHNIRNIGGVVQLNGNYILQNLGDFNSNLVVNNALNTTDTLEIINNYDLSTCNAPFLCNYLNTHDTAFINSNGTGCNSLQDIRNSCGVICSGETVEEKTWTGANNNADWNDPLNWLPAGVPGLCTRVIIPGDAPDYPSVNTSISIAGLIMMSGSRLEMNDFSLYVNNTFKLDGASINNAENIIVTRAYQPEVINSYLWGNFTCQDYSGVSVFQSNTFDGNVIISDSTGRIDGTSAIFNTTYGDFTWINNSEYGQSYLSNASPFYDLVNGDLTVVNNSYATISVGLGGDIPLKVTGNFNVQSDAGNIDINTIDFAGYQHNHIRQLGTQSININNLVNQKGGGELILDNDVRITNQLDLSIGYANIVIQGNRTLTLDKFSQVLPQLNSPDYCYIKGKVKKIGNTAFKFPLGGSSLNNSNKAAPIEISAPALDTDEFTAEYISHNPSLDGYDTSLYTPGFGGINGREYWVLNRNGSSDVTVRLYYDSIRGGVAYLYDQMQVAGWDGTKWKSWSSGGYNGTILKGDVISGMPLTQYGPLTLSYKPLRKPIITIETMDSIVCRGTIITIPYTIDTAAFTGNTYKVQASDSLGSFANPALLTVIGSEQTITAGSIPVFIPNSFNPGSHYKIRIVGNYPADTSVNTKVIIPHIIPQLSFTIVGPSPACMGNGPVKYYPSLHEPGVTYSWFLGAGGTFTTNGDTAIVNWTTPGTFNLLVQSSTICGNGPQFSRFITVKPPAPVETPVVNNIGRWLYATAPTQTTSGYQWYKDNTMIPSATNSSYYANTAGSFTVKYKNDCGEGPLSNAVSFAAPSQPQTITFDPLPNKTYGDAAFSLTATSTSGFPVAYNIISGPGSITGNTYTITSSGTVTIRASQPGSDIYDTAAYVTRSFVVSKATQTIDFTAIPEQTLGAGYTTFTAISSSGLPVTFSLTSGSGSLYGNLFYFNGSGQVAITAVQNGDTNYFAATPVIRSFCVRVPALTTIAGTAYACPGQNATYTIDNVSGLTYNWRLSNGTTYPSTTNSVNITWTTPGTYTLIVSATGSCGAASANDSLVVNVLTAIQPGIVSNMFPANGATGQQLPLTLSWIPGSNALSYDVYVWDSATVQPGTPLIADIAAVSYTLPGGSINYNKTYKWRVISKNACLQIDGPVQTFRLKSLPDLTVTNLQSPAAAFSGQTISISWTVENKGPGHTTTNQSWTDGVFLTFDTLPNFSIPPQTNPALWGESDFPSRPLLIAAKPNVSALDSGQQYSNSVNFTLPLSYSLPLHAYVITNYPANANAPLQVTRVNDTARAQPIAITLSPTPDLRVDTVFAPTTTFSGSTINLTYKVKNYGVLTPAGASWTDKVYFSQSPIFNINTAIPAKLPKANGTYYDNAPDATIVNNTQLEADDVYTRSLQVVVPNYIFGTYFIYVIANSTTTLYEGALSNNNLNRCQAQVFLTPTPHLTVSSVTFPVTTASITQPIGINWNISNEGFADNMEKNKGHYFVPNGTCTTGMAIRDSVNFGSSYWLDRVYLSTDPVSLNTSNAILVNETTQGIFNSGSGVDNITPPALCQPLGTNTAQFNLNTFNVIKTGSTHPKTASFNVPSNLATGNYYVYVLTNATRTVFEYPGTPETKRSTLPITIQRPDAIVSAVTAPANATGGQAVTINYNVLNNGPGAVFNHLRKDKLYVSTSAVFNASAQLIDSTSYTEDLPVGTAVPHSFNYTFPSSTSGTRYIHVQVNADSAFRETNSGNNTGTATILVSSASPNDLVVSSIQLADTIFTVFAAPVKYTVTNNGSATTTGTWTDSIYISCSPTFSYATSYYIAKRSHSETVTSGGSYTDSFNVNLPMTFYINGCFPRTNFNTAYFFIKTNANNAVYEGANGNNNITGTGSRIVVNPSVDHIVTTLTGADTATVARPYAMSWTVKNIGYNPGAGYYTSWYDVIYFSADSVFNTNAVQSSGYFETSTLNTGQTYSDTKNTIPPNIATGDYYVFAKTNASPSYGIAHETIVDNNANLIRDEVGAAKKIHVIQPLLPDLTDSILTAPAMVAIGQPLTMVHKATNSGAGITYSSSWNDDVWLSPDFIPGNNGSDILLSGKYHVGALQPGQSYNDTITATIPLTVTPGNYVLISRLNASGNLFESNNTNNLSIQYITIYSPAPSDLVVENIIKPDTVFLGYPLDPAKWVIKNISSNTASGVSSDGIYLSKNSLLDSTAVLLGIKNKTINMGPLATDTISFAPVVTNATEGNYNLLVKTDLLNNIVESNKDNNTGMAATPIYVSVKELSLNVVTSNTLSNSSRFYKLVIPDSLDGATLLVTLKSGDSLSMKNQLFIGKGYVPSAAHFDYSYNTPNYGNQDIVMTSVSEGVYYITIRCVSINPVVQNITLKAEKLPFKILNVQSSSGGNSGNVTIKINGSLFIPGMTAKLSKPGTVINASAVYFSNSTVVFATFNLQGKPLGVYDVTLTKPDTTIAVLANGFSVVVPNNGGLITGGGINTGAGDGNSPGCAPGAASGLNSQLVTEIVAPDKVLIGWPFVIQINYNNPTNVDIPAQARTLYSDHNVLMSFTPEAVTSGTTSLYLELTEQNGPPGIIRAGGSGSILIYSKMHISLARGTTILFNLK